MTVENTALPAVIYTRISLDKDKDGLAVDRQEEGSRLLADRIGWTVTEVYTDTLTASKENKRRPDFERLVADIEAGEVDRVLLWHCDRLYRQPQDLERLVSIVEHHHVDIRTVLAGTST